MSLQNESSAACAISGGAALPSLSMRIIGYWVDIDRPNLPDPAEHVDLDWERSERETVACYLNGGRPVTIGSGCSQCRICGAANGFEEFTDGAYQWPEGLAHYVLDHSVRLPEEIIEHALSHASQAKEVRLVDTSWWLDTTSGTPA